MQTISVYLYPIKIELIATTSGSTLEYKNVYQKNIKLYQGMDNTLEFDIKNPDQKRIDVNTLQDIKLILMDQQGNALPNSPYPITPTHRRGIATTTIPYEDLLHLSHQYLKYTVVATKHNAQVPLYSNTAFDASNTIEFITSALPNCPKPRVYDSFISEMDGRGLPLYRSSAIPATFNQATKTEFLTFCIEAVEFSGSVWLEATEQDVVTNEAFRKAGLIAGSWTIDDTALFSGIVPYGFRIPVKQFKYFRVMYQTLASNGIGASFYVTNNGSDYIVNIRHGGTGYAIGSKIKILGSHLGGQDAVHDIILTVTALGAGQSVSNSSYATSSIAAVQWQGTPPDNNARFLVSGSNFAGSIKQVTVYQA